MAEQPSNVGPEGAGDLGFLRRMYFPHLSKEHVADLVAWSQVKGFDIWAGHVCAKTEMTDDGLRLVPMVKIDGLRAKAHATGLYAGCELNEVERDEAGKVVAAIATTYRMVHGEARPFRARAYLKMYYPGPGVSPFWEPDKGQEQQLGKCAKALSLREAFSELSDCYTPEEFDQERAVRRGPAKAPANVVQREDGRVLDLSDAQV